MKRIFRAVKLTVVLAFLAACGGGGSFDNELGLRVINASPDAPPVGFLVDGVSWFSLDYKGGAGFRYLTPAPRQVILALAIPVQTPTGTSVIPDSLDDPRGPPSSRVSPPRIRCPPQRGNSTPDGICRSRSRRATLVGITRRATTSPLP